MKQEIKFNEEQFEEIIGLWKVTNEQLSFISEALKELNEGGIQVNPDSTKPIDLNVNLSGTETALNRIYDTLSRRK